MGERVCIPLDLKYKKLWPSIARGAGMGEEGDGEGERMGKEMRRDVEGFLGEGDHSLCPPKSCKSASFRISLVCTSSSRRKKEPTP